MDSLPAESNQTRVITLQPGAEDGSEEFKASLLIHLALLMFLTAWFALRGTEPPKLPTIYPIRLVGPNLIPRPGSGLVPRQKIGSRLGRGDSTRLSKGQLKKRLKKSSSAPASLVPKGSAKNSPDSKKATNTPQPTAVQETPVGFRDSKPFIPSPQFDDVSHAISEPSPSTLVTPPLSGGQMGEPMEMPVQDEVLSASAPSRSGDQAAPPSGTPGAAAEAGGGEVEVAGIESLGGGAESFAPPKIIQKVLPEYPNWARKKGLRGQATYKVLVQEAGTVGDVLTMASTIDPRLAITGAQALRRWVFSPVLVNGEPRETWVMLTVQFKLN